MTHYSVLADSCFTIHKTGTCNSLIKFVTACISEMHRVAYTSKAHNETSNRPYQFKGCTVLIT